MNVSALAMKFGLLFSAVFGLSTVVDGSQFRDDVLVLMYETDDSLQHDPKSPLHFFQQKGKIANLQTTVFGGKLAYHGFGDKYQTLKPLLEVADKNKLVILADARDVILNIPDNKAFASLAIDNFMETYKKLTADAPNAVVLSAESQCCVSAMAHAHPGEYFDPITKERKSRACSSGRSDCLWYPSPNLEDWQTFMENLAFDTTGEDLSDVYLNAGLMAGYPEDLINLLTVLNIDPSEDDQAVLSGLLYQFPDMIKLDYKQEMFGNNQWPRGLVDGCVFEPQGDHLSLVHTETGTEPLILHTPGKFYDCLDILIEDLGGVSQQRYLFGLEHMSQVATNNGLTVTSERDQSERRRRLGFLSKLHEMLDNIKEKLFHSNIRSERIEKIPDDIENIPDDMIDSNDGVSNYRVASNYGVTDGENYGVSNYGVASNYGVTNYGVTRTETGTVKTGTVTRTVTKSAKKTKAAPAKDDRSFTLNYDVSKSDVSSNSEGKSDVSSNSEVSNYGYATIPNYGVSNYGVSNYGVSNYGVSNYGTTNYGVTKMAGVTDGVSNYGVSNYGMTNPNDEENYGNYGNYGGSRRSRRRRLRPRRAL